ncbi:MAG: ATP-binding protein [Tepidisphaeraceae bacterium]|jgi:serine/threonine-protein kinase RsbW
MNGGNGERQPGELHMEVSSHPANLSEARKAVESLCRECGFAEASWHEIGLVVNEAMANVIRHAYQGDKERPMHLDARFDEQAVHIWIRDWGNGVNPLDLPQTKRDRLEPGGIGLVCLRQLMDEVEFCPQEDGMLLKMSRRLDHGPGACGEDEQDRRRAG